MRSMFNKEFFKCSQFTHINRCTFSLVINIAFCNIKRLRIFLTQKKQVLCGLQGIFLLFNCQTPVSNSRLQHHHSIRKISNMQAKILQLLVHIFKILYNSS